MADDTDVLIKFWEDQWVEVRHIENQRATVTNLVIIIASAVVSFIAQRGLGFDSLSLTLLLIFLGIYGTVVTIKLYERYHFAISRMQRFRKRIDELHPNAQILQLIEIADAEHRKKYARLEKLHL